MENYRELIINSLKNMISLMYTEGYHHETKFFAQVVKGMAENLKDVEVIGLATLLENEATALIQDQNYAYEHMHDADEEYFTDREAIKTLCINLFYKDKVFSVDMSKYQIIVDKNKAILVKSKRYDNLSRYVDEKKVLDKIYVKMKSQLYTFLSKGDKSKVLSEQFVKDLYPTELEEIYRLANNHVKSEIEKAKYKLKNS